MIQLDDVGFLGIDSVRTRAYLSCLKKSGIIPSAAIEIKNERANLTFNENKFFNTNISFQDYFQNEAHIKLDTSDINSVLVENELRNAKQKYWIYSGPAGIIVKNNILSTGKDLLHVHPGKIPDYRGSTTIYYSVLMENKIYCSAFFLAEKIDAGDLISYKEFEVPKDKENIDYVYDPFYRAELLVEILQTYKKIGMFPLYKQSHSPCDFFIIHPVLKHLAILRQS